MPHDTMQTLIRLRRLGRDEAQQDLARATLAETEAATLASEAEQSILVEQDVASAITADDGAVEAFARWLPGARTRVNQAWAILERAQAEVARARARLSASRTALETVEALAGERQATADTQRAKLTERELDDVYQRRRPADMPPV